MNFVSSGYYRVTQPTYQAFSWLVATSNTTFNNLMYLSQGGGLQVNGSISGTGSLTLAGGINVATIVSSSIAVLNSLQITNASTLLGALTVSGVSTLASLIVLGTTSLATLTTSGLATLNSLTVSGATTVSTITSSGLATLASLTVSGVASLFRIQHANVRLTASANYTVSTLPSVIFVDGNSITIGIDTTSMALGTQFTCVKTPQCTTSYTVQNWTGSYGTHYSMAGSPYYTSSVVPTNSRTFILSNSGGTGNYWATISSFTV